MASNKNLHFYFPFLLLLFLIACGQQTEKLKEKDIVDDPKSLNDYISTNIQKALAEALSAEGKFSDSFQLHYYPVVEDFYYSKEYAPVWSDTGVWKPMVSQLLHYFDTAALDGLYKEDYQASRILSLKNKLDADSIARTDAVLWTKADILMTDAFMHIVADIKQGRLVSDSASWKNDTARYQPFFATQLNKLIAGDSLHTIFRSLHPAHAGYHALKKGIASFIDSMDTKTYTYLNYPYKKGDAKDSMAFFKQLQLRFIESNEMKIDKNVMPDSLQWAKVISQYQKKKKLVVDGKPGPQLVKSLNLTDKERFNRIAVTLDRYKLLPDSLPERYVWVNLPGYYLTVWDTDTLVLTSKIICGKPITPTPTLTSNISDLVIYPTWTVPESIIKKELLPGLKRNSGYLAKKGLNLYNYKGERIDPSTINWAKYSKGIPYKVQQGSGDDNALGVIKFNFENPYFVYLHDTNQRYLFKNSFRALSHGCVRVQEWDKLAAYIARNDSLRLKPRDTLRYTADSITNWIANKERHRITVKSRVPLYIRYFSCEGIDGQIRFYDDIYNDDKRLKDLYFSKN